MGGEGRHAAEARSPRPLEHRGGLVRSFPGESPAGAPCPVGRARDGGTGSGARAAFYHVTSGGSQKPRALGWAGS